MNMTWLEGEVIVSVCVHCPLSIPLASPSPTNSSQVRWKAGQRTAERAISRSRVRWPSPYTVCVRCMRGGIWPKISGNLIPS